MSRINPLGLRAFGPISSGFSSLTANADETVRATEPTGYTGVSGDYAYQLIRGNIEVSDFITGEQNFANITSETKIELKHCKLVCTSSGNLSRPVHVTVFLAAIPIYPTEGNTQVTARFAEYMGANYVTSVQPHRNRPQQAHCHILGQFNFKVGGTSGYDPRWIRSLNGVETANFSDVPALNHYQVMTKNFKFGSGVTVQCYKTTDVTWIDTTSFTQANLYFLSGNLNTPISLQYISRYQQIKGQFLGGETASTQPKDTLSFYMWQWFRVNQPGSAEQSSLIWKGDQDLVEAVPLG